MLTALLGIVLACHLPPDFEAFEVSKGLLRLKLCRLLCGC